jgi:type II secretion system protein G
MKIGSHLKSGTDQDLPSRNWRTPWQTGCEILFRRPPTTNNAFTLIEILVVISIIAILASLVLGSASGINKKAARDRAKTEIGALSAALEDYRTTYGDYPGATNAYGTANSEGANILYRALVVADPTYNPQGKVFLPVSKSMSSSTNYGNSANHFVDPFGQPYQYKYPGDANKSGKDTYDLFSYGGSTKTADTPANQETWVKNW